MKRRREIPAERLAELAKIRADAAAPVTAEQDRVLTRPPDGDDLDRIAHAAGALLGDLTDPRLADLVDSAKYQHRREWKEIAAALGLDPDDEPAVRNLSQNHRRRRRA